MKFKKLFAVLLAALLLLLSIAGCVQSPGENAGTESSTDQSSSDPNLEGNMYKTGLPILKEKESFNIMVKKQSLSKNTYPEKIPVQEVEQETNVHIIWDEISGTGWNEKVNLSFASNSLPDAFIGGIGANIIVQNTDALVPIDDYVSEYAPNIEKLWEKHPHIKAAITAPDGKIYALNTGESSPWGVTASLLLINKTWLDELKMDIPRTTDEFYNVLKAFKDNDMNKNGKPDEIPFTFCQQNESYNLDSLFGAFGVLENGLHLMIENGKVVFPATRPEFRKALEWFHSLVKEGLMDVEGFSQTLEQLQAKGKEPQVRLGSFISYNADTATGDNHVHYIPIEPLDGGQGKVLWNRRDRSVGTLAGFVITKACRKPAVLLRWHDYINSSWENKMRWSHGPEGYAWKFNEDGLWIQNNDNVPEGASWGEYRQTVSPGSSANWYMDADEIMYKRLLAPRTQGRLDAITDLYQKYFPEEILIVGYEDLSISNEKNLLLVEIEAYLSNFIATSIMNGVTDAQWQKHLETCKSLNVDRYIQMQQEYYDSTK